MKTYLTYGLIIIAAILIANALNELVVSPALEKVK